MTHDSPPDPLASVVRAHGPWTAESMWLGGDVCTNGPGVFGGAHRLRQLLQMAADSCRKPIQELRVLDLGALEGLASLEFARHGSTVVAVEGREGNAAKIRAAAEIVGVQLEVIVEDVRRLPELGLGRFDLVLCLGLLYHLDWPSIPPFLAAIAAAGDVVVIDTHLCAHPDTSFEHEGKTYVGTRYREYPSEEAAGSFESHPWSAIGNVESAWLTRESLTNLLADTGFDSVVEGLHPRVGWQGPGRTILIARRNPAAALRSLPPGTELPPVRWPEITSPAPR